MFCIPPCIFQVSRVTSTTDSQKYYIYRLGPHQNLFFLFLLPSPGDCGSNFVLGDQLCFSWFSVKVPISCCTPATLADASLFTTRPTLELGNWQQELVCCPTRWYLQGIYLYFTKHASKKYCIAMCYNKTKPLKKNKAVTFVLTAGKMSLKAKYTTNFNFRFLDEKKFKDVYSVQLPYSRWWLIWKNGR